MMIYTCVKPQDNFQESFLIVEDIREIMYFWHINNKHIP
jgi:hypothetical protein